MKYLSIDCETTGLDPKTSELLEVGLVIFNSEEVYKADNTNALRIVLVKEQIKGNIFAINMNIKLLNEMFNVIEKFDEPENDGIIEIITEELTTWYVDVRPQNKLANLFDDFLLDDNKALDNLSYKLTSFLSKAKVEGKLNIAGKNFSNFDKEFLNQYKCFQDVILKRRRHRVLDIGSMYVTAQDEVIPDLKECLKRAGLNNEVPHTAVEDAILVVKAAQYKFNNY